VTEKQRSYRRCGELLVLALALLGPACDGVPDQRDDAPQIGLARGARWSVMSVRPPYLHGPFFNLVLRQHVLTGWIAGESAPGGAVRVRIDEDGASGQGPLGPVAMDIVDEPDAVVAEGLWNGHRVHLVFSPAGVRGTVADNARPAVRSPLDRVPGMPVRSPTSVLLARAMEPPARDSSCEYLLDGRDQSGRMLGTSICQGMPLPTRLEIPAAADALLTRPELVTVLVAVLSAPPLAATDPLPGAAELGWPGDTVGGF
jgi:hypothetical protein